MLCTAGVVCVAAAENPHKSRDRMLYKSRTGWVIGNSLFEMEKMVPSCVLISRNGRGQRKSCARECCSQCGYFSVQHVTSFSEAWCLSASTKDVSASASRDGPLPDPKILSCAVSFSAVASTKTPESVSASKLWDVSQHARASERRNQNACLGFWRIWCRYLCDFRLWDYWSLRDRLRLSDGRVAKKLGL